MLIAVAGVSKKRVRVKGSPVIVTPFRPTSFIVGETIEFENALILFPPLISNCVKDVPKKLTVFVFVSTSRPIPELPTRFSVFVFIFKFKVKTPGQRQVSLSNCYLKKNGRNY